MSLVKRILKLSYGIISAMIIVFCLFPEALARIYTDITGLIHASVPALIVMCSSYFISVGAQVFFLAVSGTGSTKTAFRLELVALAAYMIYCSAVIGWLKADIAVCWTAEHIYSGVLLACSWWYTVSYTHLTLPTMAVV